jgi:D-amino-acid dehydrogenase
MAAGTGRVMADLITGREPEISLEGLGLARYGRAAIAQAAAGSPLRPSRA